MNCNTPTPPTPGAPGAESDAEVNAALAKLRGWIDVYDGRGRQPFGGSMYRAGRRKIHDYCSPDAPHSLRVELVEAVIKAGRFPEFIEAEPARPSERAKALLPAITDQVVRRGNDANESMILSLFGLCFLAEPAILARAALAALRAGEVNRGE